MDVPPDAPDRDAEAGRWLPGTAVLEAQLSPELQRSLGDLLGRDAFPTLGEWVALVRSHAGGESIAGDGGSVGRSFVERCPGKQR